jgi:[ribosomal protein S5]-alanine N-acetyltransferase
MATRRRWQDRGMGRAVAIEGRIVLEVVGPEDETEVLAAVNASRALHHPWIDAPDTPERFAVMLERTLQPEHHSFLVREVDTGTLAGAINVTNIVRGAFQSAFTGYYAFAGGDGRGLMAEGLRAVIAYAFGALGLHRLEANIQPGNAPSIALAERCGFRLEGFSPSYLLVDGAWRDHQRFAITVEDRPSA